MSRRMMLAVAAAGAMSGPALAQSPQTKVEPGTGPTSTMTEQVPQMKRDAETIKTDAAANAAKPLPSSKAMGDAVPSMKPGDAVSGQQAAASPTMTLSEQDGKQWVDKPVYSSDGQNLGEVADFQRNSDGKVVGMHADVGGLWGFGQKRINLVPSQFKFDSDRVVLGLTAAQAKALPRVQL